MLKRFLCCFVVFLFLVPSLVAYTYNKATEGPLTVDMQKPAAIEKLDTPLTVHAQLKNTGDAALAVRLTFTTIETIEFVGAGDDKRKLVREVNVPAKGEAGVDFQVVGKLGSLSVHYPIYLDAEWNTGGKATSLQAVLPVESKITPNPNWPGSNAAAGKIIEQVGDMPLNTLAADTGLLLTNLTTYRPIWTLDKAANKINYLPIGWEGSDAASAASVSRGPMTRGAQPRQAFSMHPPYRMGAGNAGVEYRFKLPQTSPITLTCYGAMRDVGPTESPSDGVTFGIVVSEGGKDKIVAQKHVASKTWTPLEADLTPYAGKEILLCLISDPGPKRDTSCDGCYWGDPVLFAGKKPIYADPAALAKQQAELERECVAAMKAGSSTSERTRVFSLAGGLRAVVTSGDNGFLDGKIALGSAQKFIVYNGIRVAVKDAPIGIWPAAPPAGPWVAAKTDNGFAWTQEVQCDGKTVTMSYALRANGPALQLSVDCSEPAWISSVQLGPASDTAERVYFGHGYCVVEPKRVTIGADGHRLSTSHVGMEYPGGLAVLLATTTPPAQFVIDPENKLATLDIRPGTRLTLLPGMKGMLDCAIRYRPLNHLNKAAPGVKTKAGRLCFDIWGNTYARHLEIVEHAVKYGITESLFVIHSWQRYGYDNRLPDIWPPNQRFGTLAELQEALKKCDEAGILYGLHDNYIDIYPDAEGYATEELSFERNGQPRKAWFNRGIQARSYQLRPDKVAPYLKRNFDLMLPHLPQSCYFVDVFSSMPPVDFYDKSGRFHSRTETLQHWGESFDTIRERLTEVSRPRQTTLSPQERERFYAPSISESGHDFLIGHLDGADCQFMFLSPEPGEQRTYLPCKDWERVPWYDAVNHTNFSLHGVGYSGRYEGGRGRSLHGIESDDYLTTEVLTGHALMVDAGCATRGAVRKYWFLQPLVRDFVDSEIASADYVDGDIHRQKIVWKSTDGKRTTTVWINRGADDWQPVELKKAPLANAAKLTLPPYGFYAENATKQAGIVRTEGDVVEFCSDRSGKTVRTYVNGRNFSSGGPLPIRPSLKAFRYQGDNRFKADLVWNVKTPPVNDYVPFIHLVTTEWKPGDDGEGIVGQFGINKPKSLTEWRGEIVTPLQNTVIPDNIPSGKYRILIGLYDPKDGYRARLMGQAFGNQRFTVGNLNITRDQNGKIRTIAYEKEPEPQLPPLEKELAERLLPPARPVNVGPVTTKGGFLCEQFEQRTVLTPLPEEGVIDVTCAWSKPNAKITAESADGQKIREMNIGSKNGRVTFMTKPDEFRYVVE